MIPRPAVRCAERRLIDRHFAARIRPAEESTLRAHLPDCARCRKYYEAHMLYAELAPARPGLAARLAPGLGVAAAPPAPASEWLPSRRAWLVGAAAAAACLALLATGQGVRRSEPDFGVRGLASDGTGPALEIYRVTRDGATKPADGWFAAGDELAFAYRNPTGFTRLMIFGADDRGDIYWFHPAWTDADKDPVAVPINAGVGPFELPEAIQHPVRGGRLRVVALFTNAAASVRSIEETWRQRRSEFDRGDPPGSARIETWLEVRP
jgi:hypothetical protein